ncbi:MAG: hypothetical protein ACRCZB_07165 [Bacteroidales bacterium]
MIIANGAIQQKYKTGGGLNPETGYPNKPSVEWGEPIPCQYRANKYNNKGKVNGESFTVASYEILIEEQPYFSERLRLLNANNELVGEYTVIEKEPLDGVCQIRILV